MNSLYPLKFTPIFKDKIWGGNKIHSVLHKDYAPLPNCGETWEISGVKDNESVVSNGTLAGTSLPKLIQNYKEVLVGEKVYKLFHDEFPLLIKFIDANQDLSIQVHPGDELAKKRHNSLGKTEMWYVLQADEGAKLISGFNQPLSKEKYLEYFNAGKLTEILNEEKVKAGDVFYIPSGRVHTIGKGLLLAEIQQTSDITYRIYDFDRTDDQGNKRELHVKQALDAIDFKHYPSYKSIYEDQLNTPVMLAECPYFKTNKLVFDQPARRLYKDLDSFVIYIITEGSCQIMYDQGKHLSLEKGEVVLIPAILDDIILNPSGTCTLLETYIP